MQHVCSAINWGGFFFRNERHAYLRTKRQSKAHREGRDVTKTISVDQRVTASCLHKTKSLNFISIHVIDFYKKLDLYQRIQNSVGKVSFVFNRPK